VERSCGCVRAARPRRERFVVRASKVFEWEYEDGEATGSEASELVKGLASKLQTETPLFGLLNKLFSPAGVSGELTYQEFSRALYDNVSSQFHISCENLEKRFGDIAGVRGCIFCLWLACYGTGVVKEEAMAESCSKLRQNEDLSYFIELFEYQKDEAKDLRAKKGVEAPRVTQENKIRVAIDNMLSLMNLDAIDGETQIDFYEILWCCFPSSEPSFVKNLISTHPKAVRQV